MLYSIEVYFDQHTEELITNQPLHIEDSTIQPIHLQWPTRPHITLALYSEIDLEQSDQLLRQIASSISPFCVTLYSIQHFSDRNEIFLSPCTNKKLYQLQQSLYQMFIHYELFNKDAYQPEHWIPHCTLSYPDRNQTSDIFQSFPHNHGELKKITALCSEIGISEVNFPSHEIKSYTLHS